MPGTDRLVAGLDLGSTGIKVLVTDEAGHEVHTEQAPTPWRAGEAGAAELDADALLAVVEAILARTSGHLDAPVLALSISGMGETGMLIDEQGHAVAPAFAWYDPRGQEQVRRFPDHIRASFAGRTGLPLGSQISAAKLAHLRDAGVPLAGRRWLNLPEFVAASLGGRIALEYSLTSRTGLIDQDTGEPWPEMLDHLGVRSDFLPPLLVAGEDLGPAAGRLPGRFVGARLSVAGHDHLVAAEAEGIAPDQYHVSMGTAQVLLRVIDEPLGYPARARLAEYLINEVRHVVPGKHVLVAGVKSGLVMRRALQAFGIGDRAGRDRLDADVLALPFEGTLAAGSIEVSGARNNDGVLRVGLHTDGASPAEIFGAVLRHINDEIALLIEAMDRELPPAAGSVLTGGWAGMASVVRAQSRVLPRPTVAGREQETAYGATRVAARMLRTYESSNRVPQHKESR